MCMRDKTSLKQGQSERIYHPTALVPLMTDVPAKVPLTNQSLFTIPQPFALVQHIQHCIE